MINKIVIDKTSFYSRCAILVDGKLMELHIMQQRDKSIEGNIFAGRIETISKGIDAAFVNIGQKNNAFLSIDENSSFKCGQTIIVQALKDASKGKGVYATTNISFAGTYTIVFPDSDDGKNGHVGISSKIADKAERNRLIELVRPFVPNGCSVVVRTGARGLGEEIINDLNEVTEKMNIALSHAAYIKPPSLLYEEDSFLEKTIRDTLCYGIKEIVVNTEETYKEIKPFADKNSMNVNVHKGSLLTFEHYGLESKVKELLQKRVWLKSGAFLIIDETEALVAIDVNTGKSKKRATIGETLYLANLEAAKEIPRQLKLRNLSGIIVVDFIDMKCDEMRDELLVVLKKECEKDRTKTVVIGFSELGLALITRKKTREPLSRTLLTDCGCIGGRTYSDEFIAFDIYMTILKKIINTGKKNFTVCADKSVLNYLGHEIANISEKYGVTILTEEKAGSGGEYTVK